MRHNLSLSALRTTGGILLVVGLLVALGLDLIMFSPAYGAGMSSTGGTITGTVTVGGQSAAGITVELHQRSNSGTDAVLATATSDTTGTYNFAGQPSAPNDAFYYVRLTGGKNTLSAWYSFPIIYQSGTDFTVPSVELGDVQLASPGQGVTVSLPTTLQWQLRRSGETYRVFIYAQGKTDKTVLDSGSLGASNQFTITQGALPDGEYEAVVQVRDAVVGYGQSQARFHFTVGKASAGISAAPGADSGTQNQPQPSQPEQGNAPAIQQGQGAAPSAKPSPDQSKAQNVAAPNLQVNLSADKSSVSQGDRIMYTIEVSNAGAGAASGVVVTDQLPAGVAVDPAQPSSTAGSVHVQGNLVTAQVGDVAPNSKVTIQIPAKVTSDAANNLSNQAAAQYGGATDPVRSNAYIAQVAEPATGPAPSQPGQPSGGEAAQVPSSPPQAQQQAPEQQPAGAQQGAQPAAPSAQQPQQPPQQPPQSQPQAQQNQPPAQKPAGQTKQAAASIPQTGGSFPVVFALVLVVFTLLARYLRGRKYRRI